MIVAKVERALLSERHARGIVFIEHAFELHDLLVIVDVLSCVELAQMLLTKIVQHRKMLAGIAAAELKYLSLIVALMPGFAACCTAS